MFIDKGTLLRLRIRLSGPYPCRTSRYCNEYSKFLSLLQWIDTAIYFPLLWQFSLILYGINNFANLKTQCFTSCLHQLCRKLISIVTCYLLTRRIICGLRILCSIYWILHQAEFTITYNTSKYITWTSNFFWFFICPKLAQNTPEDLPWRTAPDEFIFQTARANSFFRLLSQTAFIINTSAPYIVSVICCCQLLVCSLPWYMHAYRPLPSCNNTPIVPVARLVVSADT
jgi:hypothetical protein